MSDASAVYILKLRKCSWEFFGEFDELASPMNRSNSCISILKLPDDKLRQWITNEIKNLKEQEPVLNKEKEAHAGDGWYVSDMRVPEPPAEVQAFLDGGLRPTCT